jgi:hypothetical protein
MWHTLRGPACLHLRLFANEKEERLASRLHGYRDRPGREEKRRNLFGEQTSLCVCVYQRHGCQIFPRSSRYVTEHIVWFLSDNTHLPPNDDFSNWRTVTVIRLLVWGQGSRGSMARFHTNCGVHPACYPAGTRGSFPDYEADLLPPSAVDVTWLHGTVYAVMPWYQNWVQEWLTLIFTSKLRGFVPGIIPVSRHTKWPVGFPILSAAHRWLTVRSHFAAGFAA